MRADGKSLRITRQYLRPLIFDTVNGGQLFEKSVFFLAHFPRVASDRSMEFQPFSLHCDLGQYVPIKEGIY